jgi:DNA-binding NarL/FixJ family response regulator
MKTVVIIEDDPLIADLLSDHIENFAGYSCIGKYTGPVTYLSKGKQADFILLDIRMAEMDGLEAIPLLLKKYPQTNIVMHTSIDELDSLFTALKLGAVGYINKQSDSTELSKVLNDIGSGGAYMSTDVARKVFDYFKTTNHIIDQLSERERETANGILEGLSYKLIADKLDIAIDTVRMNIKSIYRKLNINSKAELFTLLKK